MKKVIALFTFVASYLKRLDDRAYDSLKSSGVVGFSSAGDADDDVLGFFGKDVPLTKNTRGTRDEIAQNVFYDSDF